MPGGREALRRRSDAAMPTRSETGGTGAILGDSDGPVSWPNGHAVNDAQSASRPARPRALAGHRRPRPL